MTKTPASAEDPEVNIYQREILLAFGRLGKKVYEGTVSRATIEKRRKANKVARESRRKNRG